MGHHIRIQTKDSIYFVTNRTLQQRFFFAPEESGEVNRIILGCLARAAMRHQVELFAFVFMSNHFHLLARAWFLNLHAFMRDFQAHVARRLNRFHGREGTFFARRYRSSPVLDDESMRDKMQYILNNPCQSDLVDHPSKWPGVSSWQAHLSGEGMQARWLDYAELRRLRRKDPSTPREAAMVDYELELTAPPMWDELEVDAQRARFCEFVTEGAIKLRDVRRALGRSCLGASSVMEQPWWQRPKQTKRSPAPLCHCTCHRERAEFRENVRRITSSYRAAIGRWRKGHVTPRFPEGTLPPGKRRCVGAPPPPAG